jgi:hypothetical protein
MKIEDDLGHQWKVSGGDPASKPVNLLRRHGYEYVVLPMHTLVTGELTAIYHTPEDIVPRVRLLDCLEVLSA